MHNSLAYVVSLANAEVLTLIKSQYHNETFRKLNTFKHIQLNVKFYTVKSSVHAHSHFLSHPNFSGRFQSLGRLTAVYNWRDSDYIIQWGNL